MTLREKALGPDHPDLTQDLYNLASIYDAQKRYREAEPLYRRMVTIRENAFGPNHPDVAQAIGDLAIIYHAQGRYAEAEVLSKRAMAIRENANSADDLHSAWCLDNLADSYLDQARYTEAEPLYQRSLAVREKYLGLDHPTTAESLHRLARLYERQRRHGEAETLCQRAIALRERTPGPYSPDLAASLDCLADLLKEQGRYADAELPCRRALAIFEKARGPDHPDVAQSLNSLAKLCKLQGRNAEAEQLVDRAADIVQGSGIMSPLGLECYQLRAELRWQAKRIEEALTDLRHAMDRAEQLRSQSSGGEHERAQAFAQYAGVFETMVAWQMKSGNVDEALQAAERARARSLADQLQLHGVSLLAGLPEDVAGELRNRDVRAKCRLAELQKESRVLESQREVSAEHRVKRRKELEAQLAKAQEAVVDVYRDLRNASPAYRLMLGKDFKPIPLKELQTWVAEQQAVLLQYALGDDGGYVFVVSALHEPRLLPLNLPAEEAERIGMKPGSLTAKRMKELMTVDGKPLSSLVAQPDVSASAVSRLSLLWRIIVPAAECKAITGGNVKRLMVVPDGPLSLLPFETLVVETSQQAKYLLEAGPPIVYGPSSTVLHNLITREASLPTDREPVLTVGNPAYDRVVAPVTSDVLRQITSGAGYVGVGRKLNRLPYTDWEVNWVVENFRNAGVRSLALKAGDATKAKVKSHITGRRIVHLACHGMAEQTYGNFYGALALSPVDANNPDDDGFLTLADIYELNLTGCELAILSACETNVGPEQRGEGVWALSRGFLVAGSRRVVASNWLVDDESAASLVSYFSGGIAQSEKDGNKPDYAKSLHDAKRWVRQQEKWRSPYYWGAFVLIGPN